MLLYWEFRFGLNRFNLYVAVFISPIVVYCFVVFAAIKAKREKKHQDIRCKVSFLQNLVSCVCACVCVCACMCACMCGCACVVLHVYVWMLLCTWSCILLCRTYSIVQDSLILWNLLLYGALLLLFRKRMVLCWMQRWLMMLYRWVMIEDNFGDNTRWLRPSGYG